MLLCLNEFFVDVSKNCKIILVYCLIMFFGEGLRKK